MHHGNLVVLLPSENCPQGTQRSVYKAKPSAPSYTRDQLLNCYVRQCSLFAYLLLISLYEMCLGGLHYNSLYALSLHSTLACLWVPFLCVLGRIREQEHVNL